MEQLNKRLEVKGLSKTFFGEKGYFTAIDEVSLDVYDGEFLVILGPGRCGKTVLLNIISGLEEATQGQIIYNGKEWKGINPEIGMVFQKLALMPFKTVIQNVELALKFRGMDKEKRREIARYYIELVGLKGFEDYYPKQLSGGMQQRVMIAMALSCEPKLLIADEPTTALDVTIQEQILQLIRELNEKLGMSVLFITHDMGAVANLCHNVKVMYLGQVVEEASTEELFQNPLHPYTQGLLSCIPHLGVKKGEPLPVIEGSVPPLSKVPVGCHFCTRCKMADQHCMEHEPPACEVAPGHVVKCWKYAESGKQEV